MTIYTFKKMSIYFALLTISLSAQAGPIISDSRQAGFLFGFLTTIESTQNAGDGALIVSADFSCTKHLLSEQYYCMSDIGGITGDIASIVYESFPEKSEEFFDDIIKRHGNVSCVSFEKADSAVQFNCF